MHLLFGIPTNIAASPLGFRTELDVNPKGERNYSHRRLRVHPPDSTTIPDQKNPGPSRIVFHERQSEAELRGTRWYRYIVDVPLTSISSRAGPQGYSP